MRNRLLGLTLLAAPAAALAHTGPAAHGFAAGLTHPFSGIDHLLAMVAVGLWAAQIGGRAFWALPTAFLAVMGTAAFLGTSGAGLPLMEVGIAGSVVVFGLLVALSARLPLMAGVTLSGLLAIFHGFAHGAEMAPNASLLAYGAGFITATAALHGLGMGMGAFRHAAAGRILMRAAGGGVAAAGVLMLPGLT